MKKLLLLALLGFVALAQEEEEAMPEEETP